MNQNCSISSGDGETHKKIIRKTIIHKLFSEFLLLRYMYLNSNFVVVVTQTGFGATDGIGMAISSHVRVLKQAILVIRDPSKEFTLVFLAAEILTLPGTLRFDFSDQISFIIYFLLQTVGKCIPQRILPTCSIWT